MATTKKMVKTEPAKTETTVSVNADELIKSILSNVPTESNAKEFILCRSVTHGGLNINCKSGNVYEFKNYGSDCEIEYHDLVGLVRKHSDHIFLPRFIIEDDDFLAEFPQVSKAYESLYTVDELNKILNLPVESMKVALAELPQNVFSGLVTMISTKIANGEIDSVRKIRVLSEIYDSDFNLLSEIFAR